MKLILTVTVFSLLFFFSNCGTEEQQGDKWYHHAVCTIRGKTVNGVIWLKQYTSSGQVHITGSISGLSKGKHGFHVHTYGDVSTCKATGGHYNPFHKTHGAPKDKERHVGDLGNIEAGADGVAHIDIKDSLVQLHGDLSVIGRAFVVHKGVDDLGRGTGPAKNESKKTGNAGPRLGCGVVGLAP